MTWAWEIARQVWRRGNPDGDFGALVVNYLRSGGYVVAFPDVFVLAASAVWRVEDGVPSVHMANPDDADTWFVHLAAVSPDFGGGQSHPVAAFLRLAPFRLPFAAWHRRGQGLLRRYSTDRLARLCHAFE